MENVWHSSRFMESDIYQTFVYYFYRNMKSLTRNGCLHTQKLKIKKHLAIFITIFGKKTEKTKELKIHTVDFWIAIVSSQCYQESDGGVKKKKKIVIKEKKRYLLSFHSQDALTCCRLSRRFSWSSGRAWVALVFPKLKGFLAYYVSILFRFFRVFFLYLLFFILSPFLHEYSHVCFCLSVRFRFSLSISLAFIYLFPPPPSLFASLPLSLSLLLLFFFSLPSLVHIFFQIF